MLIQTMKLYIFTKHIKLKMIKIERDFVDYMFDEFQNDSIF